MLRHIFKKESIQIVHGHAAFSALAHEALFVGSLLGLGKVFTFFFAGLLKEISGTQKNL